MKTEQFGELLIGFTNDFDKRWSDDGAGSDEKGAFWHPVSKEKGFYALGSLVRDDHKKPWGREAAMMVKIADPDTLPEAGPALKKPDNYERIWTEKGSKSDKKGSCWKPIPPEGYIALGYVFQSGHDKPSTNDMRCVRKDLTAPATIGKALWKDEGSGADEDLSAWGIVVDPDFNEKEKIALDPNSFFGTGGDDGHDRPLDEVYCLMLPIPEGEAEKVPEPPALTGFGMPDAETNTVIDKRILVPFTAIDDKDRDHKWQLEHSPFYTLVRYVNYELIMFAGNGSSAEQEKTEAITIGIEESATNEFTVNTGLSLTVGTTVSGGFMGSGVEASMSMTVSVEFGYGHSRTHTKSKQREVSLTLRTAPKSASALWATSYQLQVLRGDGTRVGRRVSIPFGTESFYVSEYKPDA